MSSFLNKIRPMNKAEKDHQARFAEFLELDRAKEVMEVVKHRQAGVFYSTTDPKIVEPVSYPQLNALKDERNLMVYVNDINNIVRRNAFKHLFKLFSPKAEDTLRRIIRRSLPERFDNLARACTLQLFADQLHFVVLGRNDLLINNISTISPVVSVYKEADAPRLLLERKGKEFSKGLLAQTDHGLFIIHDLQFGKSAEKTHIVQAMDHGFLSVERKSYSGKFRARINVLAFAHPKGVKLMRNIELLKRQFPFDFGMLSHFHLVFAVEMDGGGEGFGLTTEDATFVRSFISFAKSRKVEWVPKYDELVDRFMSLIKQSEAHFIQEVTERIAGAVKKMALGRARLMLRDEVIEEDVKEALKIARDALYVIK